MKQISKILSTLIFFNSLFSFADSPTAAELLEKSDRARGSLSKGLSWIVKLSSTQDKSETSVTYDVKVKGTNVLARCLLPPRQKDETFLFNNHNLWVFKPGLRKPISVSPRQRLSGQAANGDIATTNYAQDYSGDVLGTELIDGEETYKLKLKAKSKDLTYESINYWISKSKTLGIKAEFLTPEGKVFKVAHISYERTISVHGKKEPFISKMKIIDATFPQNFTVLEYDSPKETDLQDSFFNVNNLAR